MDKNLILRALPKMDILIEDACLRDVGRPRRVAVATAVLDEIRAGVLRGDVLEAPCYDEILARILAVADAHCAPLRRVINATGVVLHTNLGRAPLAAKVAQKVAEAAVGYCDLEFDLETGGRGSRMAGLEGLLVRITGAEAALAVNNNAAAVLLALSALCAGREVVVSRGELVEIGGSFRVPEVIGQGGAVLREVGATNVSTVADYAHAINDDTAALLKVHTSNYRIMGYTGEADLAELSGLAKEHGLPLIYDLGGGALVELSKHEPTVQKLIKHTDLLCFSGDKLLGGPQAGIIVGRADLIAKLRKHPLYRALRMDKLTLAALLATLEIYEDMEQACQEIPTLAMLTVTPQQLHEKAKSLYAMLPKSDNIKIVKTTSQAGGGSLPCEEFLSYAISISPADQKLEEQLRKRETPIIGRLHKGALLLDVRTIDPADFEEIAKALS